MDEEKDIWNVIANVLDDTATNREREVFNNWVSNNEGASKVYHILTHMSYETDLSGQDASREKILKSIQQKIEFVKQRKKVRFWQYAAASLILFILAGTWLFMGLITNKTAPLISTSTPRGVKTEILLPDSTHVTLNSGSTLSYPAKFSGKTREVLLSGEGYFEVEHNQRHPFIISTGGIKIKVLGTHFNVRNYNEESILSTTLLEGSISILTGNPSSGNKSMVMKPNEQYILNKSSGKSSLMKVDGSLYANWRQGQLYFEGKTFQFITNELQRIYNVNILIQEDTLKKEVFSGIFNATDEISHVLDLMKRHHDFNYVSKQDTIKIFKK